MKARVKATGEIVKVKDCGSVFRDGALFHGYVDAEGNKYLPEELAFDVTNKDAIYNQGWQDGWDEAVKSEIPKMHPKIKEVDFDYRESCQDATPEYTPDYWTRLEHTYVGMFMKSFLDNFDGTATMEQLLDDAIALAHALVKKMKEERK